MLCAIRAYASELRSLNGARPEHVEDSSTRRLFPASRRFLQTSGKRREEAVIEPVKFGVVGIGGYGKSHLQAVADVEADGIGKLDAAVVIDPENHPEKLAEFRTRGVRVLPDFDALLSEGGVDVVTLPIGIHHHVPLTIAALEAGYDVIVEKPLAGAVQDVDRLIEVRDRTGKTVIVGYQHLHGNSIQHLKERIVSGKLGQVKWINVKAAWPRPDSYYARNAWAGTMKRGDTWVLDSPINNALSHYVMNAVFLCGSEQDGPGAVKTVQAELYRARDIESLDTASFRTTMVDGAQVTIAMSHVVDGTWGPIMDLACENGTVHWVQGEADITYTDGTTETITEQDNRLRSLSFRNMVEVIRNPGTRVIATPEIARAQTVTINGAHESCPEINEIPSDFVREEMRNENRFLVVDGIDDLLRESAEAGKLFSEMGVPWAKATEPFDVTGYTHYPSNSDV